MAVPDARLVAAVRAGTVPDRPDGVAPDEVAAALARTMRRSDAPALAPADVSVVETHMSWVFLRGADVYKLKKAVRLDGLDFSTPALRRRHCLDEVRLNRRLAPGVYLGVEAVTRGPGGTVAIGGHGTPIDWVVHMRRLPDGGDLASALRRGLGRAEHDAIGRAAAHLSAFYAAAPGLPVTGAAYHLRLMLGTRRDLHLLRQPAYGLPARQLHAVAERQLATLERDAALFEARATEGRLVDGHGDLRPEHIWLTDPPAVIDCLEFDAALRLVDPLDDLAFLDLECGRFGAPGVGRVFLDAYVTATGDAPPSVLLRFYRRYRALRRATIAARHLDDPAVRCPAPYLERARQYLAMAAADTGGVMASAARP